MMFNLLFPLLSACSSPSDWPAAAALPESELPPSPKTLSRTWTRHEPHSTNEVAAALPVSPPQALLYQREPVVGPGLQIVERVGNNLVTSSPPLSVDGLSHARIDDATGDGDLDLILRTTRSVRIIDPQTWAVLRELRLPSDEHDVSLSAWPLQADADPDPELLIGSRYGIAHHDLDGTLLAFIPHASTPLIAQLDADPAPELLYQYPPLVLDGATFRPEPIPLSTLGYYTPGPDTDGDGVQELLHRGQSDGQLLNLATGTITPLRLGSLGLGGMLLATDAHHDGSTELWLSTIYGPTWIAADAVTGQLRDAVPALAGVHHFSNATPWDSDGDGFEEILYGGNGTLGLVDTANLEWIARHDVVSASDLVVLDMNGDGREEMIECSSGLLIVRNPDTAARIGQIPLPPEFSPYLYCQAGDIDADGDWEMAIANLRETWVFDLANGVATDLIRQPGGGSDMTLKDADGDGRADLLWNNGDDLCMASAGLTTTWCAAGVRAGAIEVGDLDADGVAEVVFGSFRGTFVLSGLTGVQIGAPSPVHTFSLSIFEHQQRTFLAGVSDQTQGIGEEITVWEWSGNQLNVVHSLTPPHYGVRHLRMDGPVAWLGGFDGVIRLDLRTGARLQDDFGYGDTRLRAVFRPTEVIMRVSDGWIAWAR